MVLLQCRSRLGHRPDEYLSNKINFMTRCVYFLGLLGDDHEPARDDCLLMGISTLL